jgi:hypothetical protein
MTSIVEVTRVRLSPSVVDEICDAYPLDMRMTKVVAPDSVMVKGKKFASVEIVDSNFKDALTFIDCTFSGNVTLREVKASGPISFINCEFGGDFTVFGTTVSAPICLIKNRISGRLSLDGTSTPKLDFQSVSAEEVAIVAHEVAAHIECLSLDNISVSGAVRVDRIAGIKHFGLSECGAMLLCIRHAGLQDSASLCIQSSRIGEIILDHIKMDSADVRVDSTLSENVYFKNCVIERSKLVFDQVIANGLFAIKQCSYLESTIDISAVTSPNLELDESLLDFVALKAKARSAIFASSLPDQNRLQTLKLLKDKFAREHRYDLEDDVFYLLKNFETRLKVRDRPWWKKPTLFTTYLLNRCVLGWGVRLRNPLISAIIMIGLCASIYYFMLDLHEAGRAVKYLGQSAHGVYGATTLSLLAFFGQHADAEISGNMPIALALGEFILGVTMTTIIVGILIRKLVR